MAKVNLEIVVRTPGIEPGQRAWKALIIASRSHPHKLAMEYLFYFCNLLSKKELFILFNYSKRCESNRNKSKNDSAQT